MPDLRPCIEQDLKNFANRSLREASLALLKTLGYQSDKTIVLEESRPQAFLDLIQESNPEASFDQKKALFADWKSADLLFQLTDDEISREATLFQDVDVKPSLLRSYLFFAIELTGGDYARGKLTAIARQINRVFPMPVMLLIRHKTSGKPVLSIAVINRRRNKVSADKDVLEKATIIRDISISDPHRGHLDILGSFAFDNLVPPKKSPINNFDALHTAWEEIFNVELLNNRFYKELANWYFWALPQVEFPKDLEPDDEKRRATGLIRMLTRLIFCWFLKEKGLIPEKLFHITNLDNILKDFDPESETSSAYYQGILQNLFFATLNQLMGKDRKTGKPYRRYVTDEDFHGKNKEHGITNLFRYPEHFKDPEQTPALFEDIPFLNGGLFECLDREDPDDKNRMKRLDGFTTRGVRPHVPDRLFFDSGETADLSGAYGDKKRKKESVTGLIHILNRYKFTIVENTPIDQEIALDPELLGKVFENLLASYNEETKTTARKQTGSFYTPRPIVDYMVDESLKAHLTRALEAKSHAKNAKARLEILLTYTEKKHDFSPEEIATLIIAIDEVKVLDPACGSGAFPMGVLHKLVYILTKLDPKNEKWEKIRIDDAQRIPDAEKRRRKIAEIANYFTKNNDDYGRKLHLIENCLYGVDIQPIAIQITKLRFFISLVCDQKTNRNKKDNHDIRPLPNLETKFVAADSLIGLPISEPDLFIKALIEPIEKEIGEAYHSHFAIQRRDQKLALQKKIKSLRHRLAETLINGLGAKKNSEIIKKAQHIADWDPFDPQSSADFFDPHWMFGRELEGGFDIVVGNPPFLFISNIERKIRENYARRFTTAEYRFDLYGFFIERALEDFLHEGGLLTFIIPHTLLSNDSFSKLRKLLLEKSSVLQIVDIGPSVFAGASNETMTFLCRKGPPLKNHSVLVSNTNASDFPVGAPEFRIAQNKWLMNPKYSWPVRISEDCYELLEQLKTDSVSLGALCTVNQGLRTGNNSRYIGPVRAGAEWKPVVGGKDIGFYDPIEPKEYVLYDRTILDAPRREEIFTTQEKIIVQEIRNISLPRRIVATLDSHQTYALQSTNVVNLRTDTPKKFSIKYILSIVNSGVINYFFRQNFPGNNHIASNQLSDIPVHIPKQIEVIICEALVGGILAAKRFDKDEVASFLEDLIDACVMECYFREHMAERDLLFHDTLAPQLIDYDSEASETQQREFLTQLHQTLNAPSHPIRNRLLRISADSPDLLAVIKREGRV